MTQPATVIPLPTAKPAPMQVQHRLQVIVIDDDRVDRAMIRRCLRNAEDFQCDVHEAATAEAGLKLLETRHFDCALVDYRLPPGNGLDLLERFYRRWPHSSTAFIMLTGQGSVDVAASAMRSGALDYLAKDQLTEAALRRSIINASEKMVLRVSLSDKTQALAERNRDLTLRNEEVRRFYQNVCHELRTPLAATREFVSLVGDGLAGAVTEEQTDLLRLATEGCDQITALLDDLLDAARMQTGKLGIQRESLRVYPFLRDVMRAHEGAARERELTLSLAIDEGDDLRVDADPVRLRQVLANLIGNALKFTAAEGVVKVSAKRDPHNARWIEFTVSDTGCGIDPAQQQRIFDRLYQATATATTDDPAALTDGLGLGLAISSEIVRLHGSELEVRSQVGQGSTFFFLLPAAKPNT
ncbi:MAG: HAMP domain-containing sensor histidine kinase [Pseudomonadota bacterium]